MTGLFYLLLTSLFYTNSEVNSPESLILLNEKNSISIYSFNPITDFCPI